MLLAAIAGAVLIDPWLVGRFAMLAPHDSVLRRVLKLARWPFRWPAWVALVGILLLHPQRRRLLPPFAVAVAIGIGSLYLLKNICGRARPDESLGPYTTQPFSFRDGFDSLPSGHTTEAFLFALLLGMYFPRTRAYFLTAAVLAGLSRVAQERHYVSDVLAGILLALIMVRASVALFGPDRFPEISWSQLRGMPGQLFTSVRHRRRRHPTARRGVETSGCERTARNGTA